MYRADNKIKYFRVMRGMSMFVLSMICEVMVELGLCIFMTAVLIFTDTGFCCSWSCCQCWSRLRFYSLQLKYMT